MPESTPGSKPKVDPKATPTKQRLSDEDLQSLKLWYAGRIALFDMTPRAQATISEPDRLADALEAIAYALDVPRNRFGKLMGVATSAVKLQNLAVVYEVGGCADVVEQAMKVARAVLKKAGRKS